jgi:hypothetical protein
VTLLSDISLPYNMPGEPVLSLIVFCDSVIVEQGSGKNSLIGTFPSLASPQFPFLLQRFFVHVSVTNIVPTPTPVSIVVNLKAASGAVLGSVGFPPITIPALKNQPIPAGGMNINLNVPFQNVAFPAPGTYECEVLWDGELIGNRKLEIVQAIQQINPPQNPQTRQQ